jgi:hypothetical protein
VQDLRIEANEDKSIPLVTLQLFMCGDYALAQYLKLLEPMDVKGRITGTIVDNSDKPVVGAEVHLLCWPKRTALTFEIPPCGKTITDATGKYTFLQGSGERTIHLKIPGFFEEEYGNFYVQTGFETVYHAIRLQPCLPGKCQPSQKPIFICQ